MSLRQHPDPYRSMPGTPLSVDPRTMAQADVDMAMNHVRIGLEVPDYFGSGARYSAGPCPRSPYPAGYEQEPYNAYQAELDRADHILRYIRLGVLFTKPILTFAHHRTNLAATMCNMALTHRTPYGQIYPHLSIDGTYPADFRYPKRLDSVKILDSKQLQWRSVCFCHRLTKYSNDRFAA